MSRVARDWAWALQITPPRKLVILALAERADDSGTCWPSLTRLSEMTGLVRSTIAVALTGLEEARLIARDRGRAGRSTRYRLLTGVAGREPDGSNVGFGSPRVGPGDTPGIHRGGPEDGPVRETVVRETDRGSPTNGPGSPAGGSAVVRETDPNRQLNRHGTESEPSLCGDDTAQSPNCSTDGRTKATAIPPNWQPGERVFAWAAKRGMTRTWVQAQIEEFLVYWTDTREARKSWDATFINRLQTLQANQPKGQAHEHEPRLADKDYLTGATPLDQIPWLDPTAYR